MRLSAFILAALALCAALPARSDAESEPVRRFDTPQAAVAALSAAAKERDFKTLRGIFGPLAHDLVTPDIVQRHEAFRTLIHRLTEKTELAKLSDSRVELRLGADAWPFPIPLVKKDGQWSFDYEAGAQEILHRRIGADELGAIAVCRAYVQAQREYASQDRTGGEVLEYAQRLRSTHGKRDGLYWHVEKGETPSPLGPLITEARAEGYHGDNRIMTDEPSPYHGYYFKILTGQAEHAPGGKYDYIINGHMIGGFALAAWPAAWGETGFMSFIVNQQGKVYEKNLGPQTAALAEALSVYDPDESWKPTKD
jgi:hypothetical protein